MKKLFILLSFIILGLQFSHAQEGKKSIGVNLGYGTEMESFSIGAKFQYNLTNPIRLETTFDYFFENDYTNMWDLNINVQYLLPLGNGFKFYPIAGITFARWSADGDLEDFIDWDENRLGANLGIGLEYEITHNLSFQADFKYQLVKDFDQGIFNFGVVYAF